MKIQVNTTGLIKNLSLVFSGNTKVIGELIQNARRAGATSIHFTTDGDGLTVCDNGKGIRDFSTLLTVAESNWDEEVMKNDQPYGMGFLATLFLAKNILIQSKGFALDIDTEELLNGGDIGEPYITEQESNTTFTLTGLSLSRANLEREINAFALGESIAVYLNGAKLDNRLSIHHSNFELKGFGKAILEDYAGDINRIYVQGFCVYRDDNNGYRTNNILHLDSSLFKARMPDRDCLVNSEDVLVNIKKAWYDQVRLMKLKELIQKRDIDSLSSWYLSVNEIKLALELGYVDRSLFSTDFSYGLTQSSDSYGFESFKRENRGMMLEDLDNTTVIESSFLSGHRIEDMRDEDVQNRICYLNRMNSSTKPIILLKSDLHEVLNEKAIELNLVTKITGEKARIDACKITSVDDCHFYDMDIDIVIADSFTMNSELGEVVIHSDDGILFSQTDSHQLTGEEDKLIMVYTSKDVRPEHIASTLGGYWFNDNSSFDYEEFNADVRSLNSWLHRSFGGTPLEVLYKIGKDELISILNRAGFKPGSELTISLNECETGYDIKLA